MENLAALINELKNSPTISNKLLRSIYVNKFTQKHHAREVWNIVKQKQRPTVHMYGWYLTFFARKGDREAVEKGVANAKNDGIHRQWNIIFAQLHAARNEISQTISLLSANLNGNPNNYKIDFGFCLQAAGTTKDSLAKFEEIYEIMRKNGMQEDRVIGNTFANLYARIGDMGEAERWVEKLRKSAVADVKSYTTLILGFFRLSKISSAQKWIEKMENDGIVMDSMAFNIILGMYTKTGQMEKAAELLENIEKLGIKPDRVTYTMFIDAAVKQDKFEEAHKWLEKMQNDGIVLEAVTVNTLIDGYAKKGDMETAEKLFHAMNEHKETKATNFTFSILINGYLQQKNFEKAFYWFDEMKKEGVNPGIKTYTSLINGCVWMKDMPAALLWFEKMKSDGIKPDRILLNSLITGFEMTNDTEEANFWLKELQKLDHPPKHATQF